jgi:L-iditol 2-dehydrogenase
MAEPAAVGLHGIDIMGIDAGDHVVVTGDGPIGVLSAQLAQICGAASVVLVGSHDSKLNAAQEAGVKCVVNRHDPDVRDKILCLLGGAKPDSVIESSGNPGAIDLAASIIRLGGKMLTFGLYQVERVSIDLDYFVVNEIQIFTSLAASTTLPRILRLMQAKQLSVLPLHRRYPFARILDAIDDAANKRTNQVKALIVNEDVVE